MRWKRLLLGVAIAAVCSPRVAEACAACGCGDQTITALGLEKPYIHRVRLAVDERYMEIRSGDSDNGDVARTLRSSLALSWTPHKRVTLSVMLPWVLTWETPLNGKPTRLISGLGDLESSLRVLFWADRKFLSRHLIWGTAGLKMPSGYKVNDSTGYPADADLQPGSGSWDPFLGVTYAYFGGVASAFVSTAYRQTTPGRDGYRFGSSFAASTAAQVQPFWWGAALAGFDLRWSEADSMANGSVRDTGGLVTFFTHAMQFSPAKSGNYMIRIAVSVPVWFLSSLNGKQQAGPQTTLSLAFDLH